MKKFDELAFIMAFEEGGLSEAEIIAGFQELVNSGHAWTLQGMYGRTAAQLLEAGLIHRPKERWADGN